MSTTDASTILSFSPPDSNELRNCDEAERQCLGFGELFLRKSRELNEAQRTLTEVLNDMDQRLGFVIRNLLDSLENCKTLLAAHSAAPVTATVEAVPEVPTTAVIPDATGTAEDGPTNVVEEPPATMNVTDVAAEANRLGLASVERSLIYVLEELGVRRVNLIGQAYASVVVDGRTIPDPFEVMSTTQQGKAMDRKVTQVLRDLWVDRDGRVVQKGSVIC